MKDGHSRSGPAIKDDLLIVKFYFEAIPLGPLATTSKIASGAIGYCSPQGSRQNVNATACVLHTRNAVYRLYRRQFVTDQLRFHTAARADAFELMILLHRTDDLGDAAPVFIGDRLFQVL